MAHNYEGRFHLNMNKNPADADLGIGSEFTIVKSGEDYYFIPADDSRWGPKLIRLTDFGETLKERFKAFMWVKQDGKKLPHEMRVTEDEDIPAPNRVRAHITDLSGFSGTPNGSGGAGRGG